MQASPTRVTSDPHQVRDHVRLTLDQLGDRLALPIAVYVASAPGRSIWRGLRNKSLADGSIPVPTRGGALVRVGLDVQELPRPVRVESDRIRKGGAPSAAQGLYRIDEQSRGWYLINLSRLSLSGAAGREGQIRTRWETSDATRSGSRVGNAWHSMTTREFVVIEPGGFDEATLVVASDRLCEQSAQWDGRTKAPAPLHLAMHTDRDHPDCRTNTFSEA